MSGLIPTLGYIIGEMPAPPGTRLAFSQAAAPLGWVTDVSAGLANCCPRSMTDASGGATGGSTLFTNWFGGGTFSINNFSITTAQMPAHNHTMTSLHQHFGSDGRNFVGYLVPGATIETGGGGSVYQAIGNSNSATTGVTLQNNGSGGALGATYVTPVLRYTDVIIAQKS